MSPPQASGRAGAGTDTPIPIGWYIQSASVPDGATLPVTFPASIVHAFAFVSGFSLSYSGGDHHVRTIAVQAQATANSTTVVQVTAHCEMNDDSGNKATASLAVTVIGLGA
ncbi:MAG TPA: hypothetical protein VL988_02840 [Solirubrobacteraceae bacterium]|nr:hypothetical protein [Solirubrobacteraceae bacterium]